MGFESDAKKSVSTGTAAPKDWLVDRQENHISPRLWSIHACRVSASSAVYRSRTASIPTGTRPASPAPYHEREC